MRILTAASRLDAIGGLERAQLAACQQLRARGHRIDLLYTDAGDLTSDWEEITERRVRVRGYALFRGAPASSLRAVAGVVRAIRRLAPDVVYVHHHHQTIGPALAGPPMVCHLHLPPPAKRSWPNHLALRRSRGLIAVSRYTGRRWSESLGLPAERVAVVPNSIDVNRFSPADAATRAHVRASLGLPSDRFLVLFAGRVDPEKGIEAALAAISRLEASDFHLAVAGDSNPGSFGGDRAKAEAYARDVRARHTGGAVSWLGRLSDVSALLAAADAVIVPSLAPDSLPMAVLEALASGTPVIASAVGGIPEMLTGPLAENLIPTADPDAFARRLREIRDWRAERPELAALGREHVERHYTARRLGDGIEATMGNAIRATRRG